MHARSLFFRLVSWPERLTILCFAAAITVASFIGPSATPYRLQQLPSIVYLIHPPVLIHGGPFVEETTLAGAEWRNGPLLHYPADLAENARTSGWVEVTCDVSAAGRPANCQIEDHDGDKRFIDEAMHYVAQARYSPAHHFGAISGGDDEPVATRQTFHVAIDANSASKLDRREGPALIYPRDMLAAHQDGWADIQCDVAETGQPSNCLILGSSANAFARPALSYIAKGTYDTASDDEPSVIYLHHHFHVQFYLND